MQDAEHDRDQCLEAARLRGALGCEYLRTASSGIQFEVDRGRERKVEQISTDDVTIRLWLDGGREGLASGPFASSAALVDAAVSAAESAEMDRFAGPVEQLNRPPRGLGIDDRRYGALEMEDRVDVVSGIERSVRAVDRRLVPSGVTWRDSRTFRLFGSTRGVAAQEWSTLFEGEVTVAGSHRGDNVVASSSVASRSFASLASVPYGANLARRVAAVLVDGRSLNPGPVRVVLAPTATARLFERIAEAFDHATVSSGGNFLVRDGRMVQVHPRIHLLDDGQAPAGLRSHAFDDRGCVPRPITLIKEGVLDERLLDPRTARSVERHPTGHMFGTGLRPGNLSIRGGTRSINAITSELGGIMLFLEHLPDLSDAVDLRTGELDCVVSGVVRDGKESVGAVRNRRLTGNLAQALTDLVQVCSDTDRVRHVDAPGMILDGFTLG
ncbi:MAG: PmbA protein [Myxococcota bacterium]|jgi:PmbA protein